MDVVFYVCIVRRGAVGARVWGVGVFCHADVCFCLVCITGQVGLGVRSWPSNRATEGSNPKGTRLYFVILLKNVEKKSLIGTDITV